MRFLLDLLRCTASPPEAFQASRILMRALVCRLLVESGFPHACIYIGGWLMNFIGNTPERGVTQMRALTFFN
jgi:hypothetical protein